MPSGDYDSRVIKTVYSLGLYPIQWDVDSLDYTGLSKEQIVNRVLPNVKNGSIILFHTSVKNTVTALDEILSVLQKNGWQFVTVKELILKDNFTFDHDGRQIKAWFIIFDFSNLGSLGIFALFCGFDLFYYVKFTKNQFEFWRNIQKILANLRLMFINRLHFAQEIFFEKHKIYNAVRNFSWSFEAYWQIKVK